MKCLLCSSAFELEKDLLNHYLSFHKVDESNWFFKRLFKIRSLPYLKKCLKCDEFVNNTKTKAEHDFLKNYNDGKKQLFEDKPLEILRFPNLTIYTIDYQKHKDSYNFFNSNSCEEDFLLNVRDKFNNDNDYQKTVKCSFVIQNKQDALLPNLKPMLDARYWSTTTYSAVYFNDFI